MMSPATKPPDWTRGRFLSLVGILFALQAGLILLFGERQHSAAPAAPASGHLRLLDTPLTPDQLSKTFFAIDPTVFPLPSPHGFSEHAWLHLSGQQYEVPSETEAPEWLTNNAARLGTNFPLLSRPKSLVPFGLADQDGSEPDPWPLFLTPEELKTQSRFEIRGELAARQITPPAELRAWPAGPSAQLLSNSVVQIAVDAAGQVVAARLLARSGSADADTNALATARSLRFRPAFSPAPIWGRAVFEWQTAEQTNAIPAGTP
jgi:TonB family protein